MSAMRDWSKPHYCEECGRRMRSSRMKVEDYPGTVIFAGKGVCTACRDASKRAERRKGDRVRHKPKRRGNPTVAELAAQGHPCVSPAPKPSNVRTYPL